MVVVVVAGLAVLGGTVFSVLTRTGERPQRPDRLSGVLLLVSAAALVTALVTALAHLASAA